MNLLLAFEIVGFIGGISTFIALMLAPMFYLGSKIDRIHEDMQKEIKDFHGRLCAIEERNKQSPLKLQDNQ